VKKAIVIYIDNNNQMIEEFSWLWKTWNLWELYTEFDIVAYCNPDVIRKLPSHDNFIKKSMISLKETDPFWKDYGFVNSFAMFNDDVEANWIKSSYDYILKTDADVFLTQHIKGLNPNKTMIGYGGYMPHNPDKFNEVKFNLDRISKKLKINDRGINSVGASIFGKSDIVVSIVKDHFKVTKFILETEWGNGIGEWPGWYKGVSSMYAIHLVVNLHLAPQLITLYSLDSLCWDNEIDSNTYHIHAWHGADFSKHKWFKHEYDQLISTKTPIIAKDYCLWIASNTLEVLKNTIRKL
jgi:hypothetical protein